MENGDGSGEIGIMLFPEYWRKGYGMAVIRQLTTLAEEMGLQTLIATTSRMNKRCIGLLQKAGFVQCAAGWMISEEKIDVPESFKELFGTYVFEKKIGLLRRLFFLRVVPGRAGNPCHKLALLYFPQTLKDKGFSGIIAA